MAPWLPKKGHKATQGHDITLYIRKAPFYGLGFRALLKSALGWFFIVQVPSPGGQERFCKVLACFCDLVSTGCNGRESTVATERVSLEFRRGKNKGW